MSAAITPGEMHRDDVLLAKLLRVRARIGLAHHSTSPGPGPFPTELRLLDEVIEELTHRDD